MQAAIPAGARNVSVLKLSGAVGSTGASIAVLLKWPQALNDRFRF